MTKPQRRLIEDGFDVVGRIANETVEGFGRVARQLGWDEESGGPNVPQGDAFGTALAVLGVAGDWFADTAGALVESLAGGNHSGDAPTVLSARVGPEAREARIPLCVTNLGASSEGQVTFTCTELYGSGGRQIAAPTIEPVRIQAFRDRDTTISVALGGDTQPGTYVGVLRADEADAWAIVEVIVEANRPPRRQALQAAEVDEVLASTTGEARGIVADRLPEALSGDDARLAHVDGLLADYPSRPAGKAWRPALCLAACRAFGAESVAVHEVMLAVELVHNAFLIHDDVEDESRSRRGMPTMHEEYGTAAAVSIGDLLCAIAAERISYAARDVPEVAARLFGEFTVLLRRSAEGQAAELAIIARGDVVIREEDYLRLVGDKTASYTTIHPVRMGAILGSGGRIPNEVLDDLTRYGVYLGAAFQVLDDLQNLVGGEGYGKDQGYDIIEGKPTLIVANLLSRIDEAERRRLGPMLGRGGQRGDGPPERERIEQVLAAMRQAGSLEYAVDKVVEYADYALAVVPAAFRSAPPNADVRFFHALPLAIKTQALALVVAPADTGRPSTGGDDAPGPRAT